MTPLRQALIDECKLRGYSERTRDSYLYAVTQLASLRCRVKHSKVNWV